MEWRRLQTLVASAATLVALATAVWPRSARAEIDLDDVCDGAKAQLQHELAGAWLTVGEPGLVRIHLRVEGERITAVITTSSSSPYRDAARRAVRHLRCSSGAEPGRSVEFEIAFLAPGAAPVPERAASAGR